MNALMDFSENRQPSGIEWLLTTILNVDALYQRRISPDKVKSIVTKFNSRSVGVLAVSLREDGKYYVCDGQHRLEAMKKLGIDFAKCEVYRGLSKQQEAQLFVDANTARKTPDAIDVFRARLITRDPIALAINEVVGKLGLSILFVYGSRNGKRPPNTIWAVNAMEDIYRIGKEKLLEEVLTLAIRSWPEDSEAVRHDILLGILAFHRKYEGRYTRAEFIHKMQLTDLGTLRRRAIAYASLSGGSTYSAIAKALQEQYDKSRRIRLEPPK